MMTRLAAASVKHRLGSFAGQLTESGISKVQLFVNGKTITFANGNAPAAANVAEGSGVIGNVVTDVRVVAASLREFVVLLRLFL